MWEDDPIVQQHNFRLLVGGTALVSAVTLLVSLSTHNWELLIRMLQVLAGVGLGLAIYAAVAWLAVSLVERSVKWLGSRRSGNIRSRGALHRKTGS